jgi:hypothetical protein
MNDELDPMDELEQIVRDISNENPDLADQFSALDNQEDPNGYMHTVSATGEVPISVAHKILDHYSHMKKHMSFPLAMIELFAFIDGIMTELRWATTQPPQEEDNGLED